MEENIVNIIRNIVKPFAIAEYVHDWQHRAAQLSAISDLYTLKIRENPFVEEEEVEFDKIFLSLPPLREAIKESFDKAYAHNKINYAFNYGCLSGWQYDTYEKLYGDVDASEKIVISACGYAICNLSMPLEIMLALCNLLYEEALHLEATNTLLGTDQSIRPWIPDDKKTNWQLVGNTNSIISYLFTEHCLYEGRGFLAAAKAAYDLKRNEIDSVIYKIEKGIFEQETNHLLTGYFWLKQLDVGDSDEELQNTLRAFLEKEPIASIDSFRGKKHRFPMFLASNYLKNRNFWQIKEIVLKNAKNCLLTGMPLVTDEQLLEATEKVANWCGHDV